MLGGEITGNTANRQGGGVFVHWDTTSVPHLGTARFTASGNSTITGNTGVGSSAAICNRGRTELMASARADKVYIWNYEGTPDQHFVLAEGSQVGGVALAYSATNKNFIEISGTWTGTAQICVIDLESHLAGGKFAGKLEPDWLDKNVIQGAQTLLSGSGFLARLPLNSFTGTPSEYEIWKNYKIEVPTSGTTVYGTFKKK
jgi:hypothetical protein